MLDDDKAEIDRLTHQIRALKSRIQHPYLRIIYRHQGYLAAYNSLFALAEAANELVEKIDRLDFTKFDRQREHELDWYQLQNAELEDETM